MKKKFNTHTLVMVALLVSLHVVFVRILPIGSGSVRISLGFLPIAVAGMCFGSLGGGTVAVIADILGMLLFSRGEVYFPLFTISEFLQGIGFGIYLNKKELSHFKTSICVVAQYFLVNLCLTSLWFYFYSILIIGNEQGYWLIFTSRLVAAAVNVPLQLVGINILLKYLKKPLRKIVRQ